MWINSVLTTHGSVHLALHPGCAIQQQLQHLVLVEVIRQGSDLMTAEFVTDCCRIALLVEELDGSLKEGFPSMGFHCTHDSITRTEQVHCHPYPPLTTIAFIFTHIVYISHHQGVWPAGSNKVAVYSQVQRFQRIWRELCMSHAIQAQTQTAFGRSYRSSEWSYSPGHQSPVAAAITSRTILDWISHSLMVVVKGLGRHALKQ